MRSDRHNGNFFWPEFALYQNHLLSVKGDHKCGQTAILDNGHSSVAKRSLSSLRPRYVFLLNQFVVMVILCKVNKICLHTMQIP